MAWRGERIVAKNTKDCFDETLHRCDVLVELFNTHKGEDGKPNDDLLRASIVFGVAALDKYCKDKFLDFFEEFYRKTLAHKSKQQYIDAYLSKAGIGVEDRLVYYRNKAMDFYFNPERAMADKLRAYLYRSTFQGTDAITELFQCYGLNNIINSAVKKSGKSDVWKAVACLIHRRHQIAHTADYGTGTSVCSIDKDEVENKLQLLKELVDCIDAIVDNKFKNKKAGVQKAAKATETRMSRLKEENFTADHHKRKGHLCVEELSSLRRIADIEKLFNVKVRRRGFMCEGSVVYSVMGNAEIWWPRIATKPNYAGWINEAQYNATGEIIGIVEKNVVNRASNDEAFRSNISRNRLRVVLAVIEGESCAVGYCYRFLGTFALNMEVSKKSHCCVWERKDTRVEVK